jgi:hypothetical protein
LHGDFVGLLPHDDSTFENELSHQLDNTTSPDHSTRTESSLSRRSRRRVLLQSRSSLGAIFQTSAA